MQFGGLVTYARRLPDGNIQSPLKNQVGEEAVVEALTLSGATPDDALLLAAGPADKIAKLLGQLRLHLGKKLNLIDAAKWAFTWVVDFPLFEWDDAEQRYFSVNHPFTAPHEADRRPAGHRAGRGPLAGLRHRPQRHGDRRRQHPYPRSGAAGEDLHACSA